MPVVQMVLLGFIVFATITLFYFVQLECGYEIYHLELVEYELLI